MSTSDNSSAAENSADLSSEPIDQKFRDNAQNAYGPLLDICGLLHGLRGMDCKELGEIILWGLFRYKPWLSCLTEDKLDGEEKRDFKEYMTPSDDDFRLMLDYVPRIMVHVPKRFEPEGFPETLSLDRSTTDWISHLKKEEPWTWGEPESPEEEGNRFMLWFTFFIDALNNVIEDTKERVGDPPEWGHLLPKEVTDWAEAKIKGRKKTALD